MSYELRNMGEKSCGGEEKVRRTYMLITPCKRSVARGKSLTSTTPELRSSSTVNQNHLLLNYFVVRSRVRVLYPELHRFQRLAWGYQRINPSDLNALSLPQKQTQFAPNS